MKHKLKEFLLLQFLIGTLFVSCSLEEEVVRNDNYNSKYQVKQQSYSELIKVTTFKNAMSKIPKVKKSNLLNGKTIMEEQYGFTIIDAPIKITETDEVIAYNLLVKSDTISQGNYFENLVVNINKQTETIKAYIVKYNIGNNDLTLTSHNSFIFNGARNAREITHNNNPIQFGKTVYEPCNHYQILMCSYEFNHVAGQECIENNFNLLYVETAISGDCMYTGPDGGGGGTGGTSGPSSGNTGGGGNTINDNPTPPCPGCPELESDVEENPCDILKDLSKPDKYNINPIVASLKQKVINQVENEWGTEFIRENYYNNTTNENVINYYTNLREGLNYDIFLASGEEYNASGHLIKYLGGIHSHPIDGYSMFSWGDLKSLMGMYEESSNSYKSEVSLLLVCYNHIDPSKPHVYAIRVENIDALKRKIK